MTFMVYSATDLFAVSPVRHTVLDTMACGITVISHAISGIPDTLRNTVNGLMVRATGAGALADAIRRFLNNKARCTGAERTAHQPGRAFTGAAGWTLCRTLCERWLKVREAMKQPVSHHALARPAVGDLKRTSVVGAIAAVSAQGVKFVLQYQRR